MNEEVIVAVGMQTPERNYDDHLQEVEVEHD